MTYRRNISLKKKKKTLLVLEGSRNAKTSGHACTKQHTKI